MSKRSLLKHLRNNKRMRIGIVQSYLIPGMDFIDLLSKLITEKFYAIPEQRKQPHPKYDLIFYFMCQQRRMKGWPLIWNLK